MNMSCAEERQLPGGRCAQIPAQQPTLAERMIKTLKEHAESNDDSSLHEVSTLYNMFLEKCYAVEREKVFDSILEEVRAGRVKATALLPFIEFEAHRRIASAATREYVINHPSDPDDHFEAVRHVTSLINTDRTSNRGAVFAGLVLLGDRRINGVANSTRSLLTLQDIQHFSRTHLNYLTATTIEFYLEWLMRLNRRDTQQEFGILANGLNLMIIYDRSGEVIETQRNLGPYGFTHRSTILQRKPFEEYFRELRPTMEQIAARSPQPDIMNNVIRIRESYCHEAPTLREQARQNKLGNGTPMTL